MYLYTQLKLKSKSRHLGIYLVFGNKVLFWKPLTALLNLLFAHVDRRLRADSLKDTLEM